MMSIFRKKEFREDDSFVNKLSYAFTHMSTLQERPAALMEKVFHLLFDACEIESLVTTEQTQYIEHIMTTEMDRENILYTAEHRGEIRGEKRGEKKGRAKARLQDAQSFLKEGIPLGTIIRAMSLTEDEVKTLKE